MENKSHAFAAGLFTIVLSVAILATLLWFRRDATVQVPYDVVTTGSVTGLAAGAPVRFRGLPVGQVQKLAFDPTHPENIVIRIQVNQAAPITHATEASLGLQGVTGMAFLQLDEHGTDRQPLPSSADHVATIPMREGLLAQLQSRGEDLMNRIDGLTASLQKLADDDSRKQLLATAASIQHAADGIDAMTQRASPALDKLPQTMQQLDRTLASTTQLADTLNRPDGPLIANLNRIGAAADGANAALAQISAQVSYDTLPRVDKLSDDVRGAMQSVGRAADMVSDRPQSFLFGAPAKRPGPGEAGFQWPEARR